MHADLQHLLQLQELDLTAERSRRRIAEMPAAHQALQVRLTERSTTVAAVKERIAANQNARRSIEKDLAAVQGRLSKYKDQLMEVKTNKEYQAMQKEIATAESDVRGWEDRLLERMEEAETLAADLKTAEAALKAEQAGVAQEQHALEDERTRLEHDVERVGDERNMIAAEVSAPALALFEHISKLRRGVALSEARDGTCTQCHVRLRPQVFNEVRRNDSLIQCESCGRILYFVPTAAGTAPQA